jgi:hypothetical protein
MIICADGSSSLMDVPIRAHTVSEYCLSFLIVFFGIALARLLVEKPTNQDSVPDSGKIFFHSLPSARTGCNPTGTRTPQE